MISDVLYSGEDAAMMSEPQHYCIAIRQRKRVGSGVKLGCACFAEIASELTKTWSSGATEFGV